MNKIRIIDLLNKIANGEEIPKVIKVHNIQYKWKDGLYIYASGSGQLCFDYFIENNKLNDEVEIIEEDKKIEKLKQYYDKDLEEYVVETYINGVNYKEIYKSKYDEMIIKKISELIDEVNKMKEGK